MPDFVVGLSLPLGFVDPAPIGQPTSIQFALLILAAVLVACGVICSLARLKWDENDRLRVASKVLMAAGGAMALVVLIWHSTTRGSWLPVGDNFDALIWLACLLGLFLFYIQGRKPLTGLDWFVGPIIVLLLVGSVLFGAREYRPYGHNAWQWVHRVSAYGGAVAFAIAAAGGAMYVIVSRRLRQKGPPGKSLGSLERLEHLNVVSVTLGFALLTIALITGIVQWSSTKQAPPLAKLLLALLAWAVYAIVLHAPINPRFRGRRAATLSICGFLLMIGVLIAVQFVGGSGR